MANALDCWSQAFRKSASADGCEAIAEWFEAQGCGCADGRGARFVEDTIRLVEMVTLPRRARAFLPLQVYDSAKARARYVLTFEGGTHQFARLYADDLSQLDLAEIHDEGVGFQSMTVAIAAVAEFESGELAKIEDVVRSDFFHDHAEEEIELTFSAGSSWVQIEVRDRE